MTIKFRATHTKRPWRKAQHSSVRAATDGKDGAKNLLLRRERVGKKWTEYGPVSCIFVWDDTDDQGYAYRLKPSAPDEVEMATVSKDKLERFELANGCSQTEIDSLFQSSSWAAADIEVERSEVEELAQAVPIPSASHTHDPNYPDEIDPGPYPEGLARAVLINEYERSSAARQRCIDHYGLKCQACQADFEAIYGPIGHGFIHIHHRVPIASIGKDYRVDPIKDLIPVCPNCHAMLHRREPPLEVEELRSLLNNG